MREKRKRKAASSSRTLVSGEKLDRNRLLSESDPCWSWVGREVQDALQISKEHILTAYGFGPRHKLRLCCDKSEKLNGKKAALQVGEDSTDGIIVVSDSDGDVPCSRGLCSRNPYCLSDLGQDKWKNEDVAKAKFLKHSLPAYDPRSERREPGLPVGLRNLGATCYANAFLQVKVWFQDLPFRRGVFQCRPTSGNEDHFEVSPVFQLQVTFSALQESTTSVFNPIKLVESLGLRTSEQQDAQEFSKLFMSHLDDEFKKQDDAKLKSLISTQFEGKMVNIVECDGCKRRSERETSFLELEIHLENATTLEERIEAMLKPEKLTGDNRYRCSACDKLQDATRYSEIRSLPPVLHVSLLRFVYDLQTFERKKSKTPLKFPPYLDMRQFLRNDKCQGSSVSSNKDTSEDIYELQGILLHKGPSAYHGHYEARVYDRRAKLWYELNDEKVKRLVSLHAPRKRININGDGGDSKRPAKRQKKAATKVVEDSDNDIESISSEEAATRTKYMVSRDAYMLIYVRKEGSELNSVVDADGLCPPQRALEFVNSMNEEHAHRCKEYEDRVEAAERDFSRIRNELRDVLAHWSVKSLNDPFHIVHSQALEKYISYWLSDRKSTPKTDPIDSALKDLEKLENVEDPREGDSKKTGEHPNSSNTPDRPSSSSSLPKVIDNADLLCEHQNINPLRAKDMKFISTEGYEKIVGQGWDFSPDLNTDNLCAVCVRDEFIEKLYQVMHPQQVAEFSLLCDTEEEESGVWISKAWLKDWRLNKPKMHVPSQEDPPPDAPVYVSHVVCEHGGLVLNTALRRRISAEASHFLQRLFPSWRPASNVLEPCAVCQEILHMSKESKHGLRIEAENEKAQLQRLYEENVFGSRALGTSDSYVLIPGEFVRTWKSWLQKPGEALRPTLVDTAQYICEHGELLHDFRSETVLNEGFALLTLEEWSVLSQLYEVGPSITISRIPETSEASGVIAQIVLDRACCDECRLKRHLDWTSTRVNVVFLKANEDVPLPQVVGTGNFSQSQASLATNGNSSPHAHQATLDKYTTNSNRSTTRQSRRIRESKKANRTTQVSIAKNTTVKEIKLAIQKKLNIVPILQRLYFRGKELEDNTRSAAELQVFDGETLYLKEDGEDMDIIVLDSDSEEPPRKVARKEGDAFKGTLLGGSLRSTPPKPEDANEKDSSRISASRTVVCPACTFENPGGSRLCSICDQIL